MSKTTLRQDISKRFRASIILVGPLLARFGRVAFPHPGGCVIGERPIDIFLDNLAIMGAKVAKKGKQYVLTAKKLQGAEIFLKVPSVTATETFIMAAVLAEGVTTLHNVALEPEVTSVAQFLKDNGAKIEGIGTTTLRIRGGGLLKTPEPKHKVIPDRLEAGSYLILGALAAKELTVEKCEPSHLHSLLDIFDRLGIPLAVEKTRITVGAMPRRTKPTAISIKTHEYPGFPTDLQAPLVVLLTQVNGEGFIFETIFEGRLQYAFDLERMGADIRLWDTHRATVYGPTKLRGRALKSPDIRAGLAFVVAAAIAKGESTIHNVYYIDRGYEDIEGKLQGVGVKIQRVTQ